MKMIVALLLLLVALSACNSQEKNHIATGDVFPGVTPADVYNDLSDEGMQLSEEWDKTSYHTTLTTYYRGIQYEIDIMGPDADHVDSVWVSVKANPEIADVLNNHQFFRYIAATPYDGSDPEGIEKWLTKHYRAKEVRKTIGRVEYILRAPSDYERVMMMRMAE